MATPAYAPYAHLSESQRTYTTPQDYYRLRDFGQKFEAAIAFMRKHGGNLYRVLLLPMLLALVPLALIGGGYSQLLNFPGKGAPSTSAALTWGPAIGLGFLLLMAVLMAQFVMLYGFVKVRMTLPDPAIRVGTGEAWRAGRRYLLPLVGYYLVAGLVSLAVVGVAFVGLKTIGPWAMALGVFVLLIPATYVVIVLAIMPSVAVFEDTNLVGTFRRCFALMRGKWWSTFGLYFVASMAIGLVAGGIGVVLMLVGLLFTIKDGGGNAAIIGMAVSQAVQFGIQLLLYPLLYVLLLFQYFNLVERRDYVSLQWQAEQLGQTPGAAQAAAAPDDELFRPSYGEQAL